MRRRALFTVVLVLMLIGCAKTEIHPPGYIHAGTAEPQIVKSGPPHEADVLRTVDVFYKPNDDAPIEEIIVVMQAELVGRNRWKKIDAETKTICTLFWERDLKIATEVQALSQEHGLHLADDYVALGVPEAGGHSGILRFYMGPTYREAAGQCDQCVAEIEGGVFNDSIFSYFPNVRVDVSGLIFEKTMLNEHELEGEGVIEKVFIKKNISATTPVAVAVVLRKSTNQSRIVLGNYGDYVVESGTESLSGKKYRKQVVLYRSGAGRRLLRTMGLSMIGDVIGLEYASHMSDAEDSQVVIGYYECASRHVVDVLTAGDSTVVGENLIVQFKERAKSVMTVKKWSDVPVEKWF